MRWLASIFRSAVRAWAIVIAAGRSSYSTTALAAAARAAAIEVAATANRL
jgi:uridylate kinase